MTAYLAKYEQLRKLVVYEHMPVKAAAKVLGITEATAGRWKAQAKRRGDDWDKVAYAHVMAKEDAENTARAIMTAMLLQFEKTMEMLEKDNSLSAAERVKLLATLSDSFNKSTSAAHKMTPQNNARSLVLLTLEKLTKYISEHEPSILEKLVALLDGFGQELEKELFK